MAKAVKMTRFSEKILNNTFTIFMLYNCRFIDEISRTFDAIKLAVTYNLEL